MKSTPLREEYMKLVCQSSTGSHVGNVRKLNEDSYFASDEGQIWCIADGMGGYEAGEVASAMVVDAVAKIEPQNSFSDSVSVLNAAIQKVNNALTVERTVGRDNRIMGCTALAVTIVENECCCLWAGDSRLYLYRDQCLYQMSRDHSVVQDLVDRGVLAQEDMQNHPQSHIITRAVGIDGNLELDSVSFDVMAGDLLLMCSDGLYGEMSAQDIMSAIMEHQNGRDITENLINQVLSGPARDNVTVSVIEVRNSAI